MIHRDIKPGNLFLCDTGQVKVTDFGIARAVGGTTLSSAGLLVGTFAYMSPEVLAKRAATGRPLVPAALASDKE